MVELTPRQKSVLQLFGSGLQYKEIASKLSISPDTVKIHLDNIRLKTGSSGRSGLLLYALRNGYASLFPRDENYDPYRLP